MTEREVLKLALKCAERCESIDGMYSWTDTITAIKEALAQPEREIDPSTTFDEVAKGLQVSRMAIAALDALTIEQRRSINEPLLKAQLFLKAAARVFKEALAQPEQEPDDGYCKACDGDQCTAKAGCVAISNPPPHRTWVGLTDEEICPWFQENTALTNEAAMRITRAIEAKLKSKNGYDT